MKQWIAERFVLFALWLDGNLLSTTPDRDTHGFRNTYLDQLLEARERRIQKRKHQHLRWWLLRRVRFRP